VNPHAALGQDQLDVAQVQSEDPLRPHGMTDDLSRKAMAAVRTGARIIRLASPASLQAPAAVNLAMP
jgi:hypothetical protein